MRGCALAPIAETDEERQRADLAAHLALAQVDDSLTYYGAEASALCRMFRHPEWTAERIAGDIAQHYRPRDGSQVELFAFLPRA